MAKREVVSVKDFHRIAQENEYYIWHFIQRNQNTTTLHFHSIFDERVSDYLNKGINSLAYIFDNIDIPYFESYTDESIDFWMGFNVPGNSLYKIPTVPSKKEQYYTPFLAGFNRFKYVGSTLESCYCEEVLMEIIMKLNPKFILEAKFD